MNRMFVFDVDGTLTPSRQPIDPQFKEWFMSFFATREFCLVSGSDYEKLREQVGDDLLQNATHVFACSGNSIWQNGIEISRSTWEADRHVYTLLSEIFKRSSYPGYRYDGIFDRRTGMLNFSIVGRNCTQEHRKEYFHWDQQNGERAAICKEVEREFTGLKCEIGGEISVDIYPHGANKSQILPFLVGSEVYFFGDGIAPGKNDWSLAVKLKAPSMSIPVTDWAQTFEILKNIEKNPPVITFSP